MNCYFSRKSYKSDRTIDSEKCMAKCIEHPKCTHYTWSPYNDNKCYIKDGKVSKSNATYLTSGWLKESLGGIYCGIVERSKFINRLTLYLTILNIHFSNSNYNNY